MKKLSLFGSMARGEAGQDSDVDLLVEFEEGSAPTLGGFVRLQDELSKLLDRRKVDLATTSILRNP